MRRTYGYASFIIFIIAGGLTGCHNGARAQALESPLTRLTAAVLAEVRYSEGPLPASDDELVAMATRNKPELQKAFAGVQVKVWHDDRNVVLIVCSPDGNCWLEDASWTPSRVDRRCYSAKPPVPATFTLHPPSRAAPAAQSRPATAPEARN